MTDLPCGKNKFVQFFREICGGCGEEKPSTEVCIHSHEARNCFNTQGGMWKDHNIDIATIREINGFHGIYGKTMDVFLTPVKPGNEFRYRHCEELNKLSDNPKKAKCYKLVVYVDCIGFKSYNDYLSERVGDEIIAVIANHLQTSWKHFMITRKGGDEFHLYNINMPKCGGDANNITITDDQIEGLYDTYLGTFMKQEFTLFFPDSPTDGCVMQTERELKGDGKDKYRFRYTIRGFQYRIGIGTTPDDAWNEAQARKHANKSGGERGEFDKSVEIKLKDNDRWYILEHHIIIIVRKDNTTENLAEELKEMLKAREYVCEIIPDSISEARSVYFIVINCEKMLKKSNDVIEHKGEKYIKISDTRKNALIQIVGHIKRETKAKDKLGAIYLLSGVSIEDL